MLLCICIVVRTLLCDLGKFVANNVRKTFQLERIFESEIAKQCMLHVSSFQHFGVDAKQHTVGGVSKM